MNAHAEISIRPSRRKFIGRWEEIDTPLGAMRCCPTPNHSHSKLWRVQVGGQEYYADIVELDMLWEGFPPARLGLETTEEDAS